MTKNIVIQGMSCMGCAKRLEEVISSLENIEKANVNFSNETLFINYNENLNMQILIDNIEKLGFKAVFQDNTKQVILGIGGMSCVGCANGIKKELIKIDGIEKIEVNFATEKAKITYNNDIRLSTIKSKIEDMGFKILEENFEEKEDFKQKEIKTMLKKVILSGVFAIPLIFISMFPMMTGQHIKNYLVYSIIQLLLTIPIMLIGNKFYTTGFKLFFRCRPNMDSLIAISTSAAFLYSVYNTINLDTNHSLYYETVGMIIFLILLGKYLETISKGKTSEAIKKLMGLAPKYATILQNDKEEKISIDEVLINDIVITKPGEKIAVDGIVIEGETYIDESMLTGESIPVYKRKDDNVFAGSINKNGYIKFKATKTSKETTLANIIKIVEDAQSTKAPIAKIADIVSGYFVPVVCIISIVASIIWYFYTKDLEFSLKIFVSVLVIACPCALGLATPTAIMVGTGKGAENGILIKSGEALEMAYKLDTIVLDKTGTITEGKPTVTDIICKNIEENKLLKIVASVEKLSEHPLAEAIVKYTLGKNIDLYENLENFEAKIGLGITANINNKNIAVGNKKLLNNLNINIEDMEEKANNFASTGKTPIYIAIDNNIKGLIAIADPIKESSKEAIKNLNDISLNIFMLTGDNKKTADAIANQLNIKNVIAEVLPLDKANCIEKLKNDGKIVAMVGDGINDAPALAKSDVGIAIGSGTDIAIESANIILIKNDLNGVYNSIRLSKKTITNIKQNLFWAFIYNVIGIPIACGILYPFGGPLLNPMIGAIAMSLSSISVLLNALRLKNFK